MKSHHSVEYDVYPFPDIGSLGPDLDGLVTQEDQLCPRLSDAEGSHRSSMTSLREVEAKCGGKTLRMPSKAGIGINLFLPLYPIESQF
jgi:hypothetical protein